MNEHLARRKALCRKIRKCKCGLKEDRCKFKKDKINYSKFGVKQNNLLKVMV